MTQNSSYFLLTAVCFQVLLSAVSHGQESAPPGSATPAAVHASSGPIHVSTDVENPNEIRGKEAVISRVETLFRDSNSLVELKESSFKIPPPDIQIIQGKTKSEDEEPFSTIVYNFRYIKPDAVQDALESIVSEEGVVEIFQKLGDESPSLNKVMVRDRSSMVDEITKFLLAVDMPQPQILVEAQIIEVYIENGAQRDVKINYTHSDAKAGTTDTYWISDTAPGQDSDPSHGTGFSFFPVASTSKNGKSDTLNIAMRLLNTSNDAKILAAPNIIADQGISSSISTGEQLPIPSSNITSSSSNLSFDYKSIGVSLKINPIIINNNSVQLEVTPEVTSVIRYQTFSQSNLVSVIPVISVRNISTRLTVSDGDIVVLGGLYSSDQNESLRKVPYISDIPFIGDFFTGRETKYYDKQLIFFMKVHILPVPKSVMLDPEEIAKQIHGVAESLKSSDRLFLNKLPNERFDIEKEMQNTAKENIERNLMERNMKLSEKLEKLDSETENAE